MLLVLGEASLRALAMVAVTAVTLWLFRVRDARVRHAAWVCVVLLMLVSPLAITWGPRARVPVRASEPIVHVIGRLDALWPSRSASYQRTLSLSSGAQASGAVDWPALAFGLYAVVALVLCARIGAGVRRIRRLLRTAHPSRGYLTHPACVVPVVVGWRHPHIVLPVESSAWPVERLTMVLAHEAAHARRRDSIIQLLSLVNRAIFWFHPAAWWLHRELGALAEEACDAAAIAAGHDRADYADCLIAIASTARGSRTRVHSVALGMASTALRRRVRAILAEPTPPACRRLVAIIIPTIVLLIACLTATPAQTMATLESARSGDGLGGFVGTFVVINDDGSFAVRYHAERSDIRFSPCSTFKLPFTAMFLETGIVDGPGTILKYDPRFAPEPHLAAQPASAHDQTLTSALQESANWYFDALSRSLDVSVLERFTTTFRYGNARVRGGAERGSYWYDGQLRISANEQVSFLRRLHNGELGLAARTTAWVRQIAQVEATPTWRLAAKTGACQAVDEETTTNWYVGWVERADDTYYFALQFEANGFDRALRERVPIARALLTQLHVLD
jgi:beta-lactamase class D